MCPRYDLICAVCGAVANSFELLQPGEARRQGAEGALRDLGQHQLYFKGISTSGAAALSPETFAKYVDCLEREDYDKLYRLDWKALNCYCRECKRSYCYEHWNPQPLSETARTPGCSDEGTCPEGHFHILDD